MGTHTRLAPFVAILTSVLLGTFLPDSPATADDDPELSVKLKGFEEVPPISTPGRGDLKGQLDGDELEFRLRYSGLEGAVAAAHIHFAQRGVNGAIIVHLCGSGGKPACPQAPATLEGTITGADVVAVAAQGISGGDLGELLHAIRAGTAYVNVHSALYLNGEIRGQVRIEDRDDD